MTGRAADQLMLKVLDTLNEAQGRWFVAREVLARGRGGLKALHEATGMSRPTILKGIRELRAKKTLTTGERVRRPGGGGNDWKPSIPDGCGRWTASWMRTPQGIR